MYKPDWFASLKSQRENESHLTEVGGWAASIALGMGGGGASLSVFSLPVSSRLTSCEGLQVKPAGPPWPARSSLT